MVGREVGALKMQGMKMLGNMTAITMECSVKRYCDNDSANFKPTS